MSSLRNGKVHKVKAQSDAKLLHCKSDCKGNPINSNMCTVKQILEIDHLHLFNLIADKQMDLVALGLLTSEQQVLLIHSKMCTYHELAFSEHHVSSSLRNGKVHKGAEVHKVMQSFFTDVKFTFRLSFVEFSRRLLRFTNSDCKSSDNQPTFYIFFEAELKPQRFTRLDMT